MTNTDLGRHVTDDWRDRVRTSGARVVAIRRDLDRGAPHSLRLFYVETGGCRWRSGAVWWKEISGLHAVVHATAAFPDRRDAAGWLRHDEPLVLVCTNGRHDSCCATFGRPVVRALRTSEHADAVWECSHIGGDRFAGNIVVLPDGLYFGRCTAESGLAVVDEYQRGQLSLDRYRGRAALAFMHQAAEYFVRRELALTAIDALTAVRRVGDPADGRFHVEVADVGTVEVSVRRSVEPAPSALTCTSSPDVTLPRV